MMKMTNALHLSPNRVCVSGFFFYLPLGIEHQLLRSSVCNVANPRCFQFPWKPLPSAKNVSAL